MQFGSVQYVNAPDPVLPNVTDEAVISTVLGEQTAVGAVIDKTGVVFIATVTGLTSKHEPNVDFIK